MKEWFKKVWKKIDYFWEYYKWFVILPAVMIYIIISLTLSYINDNRERALEIALMNTDEYEAAEQFFTEEYASYRNIDIEKLPIIVEHGFKQPKVMDEAAAADSSTVASIQKYSAMLTNSIIDVSIVPTWAADEYGKNGAFIDFREIYSEEKLEEWKDSLYYCTTEEGNRIPVGLYVAGYGKLGEFYENGEPVVTVSAYTLRKEEAIAFIEWLMTTK